MKREVRNALISMIISIAVGVGAMVAMMSNGLTLRNLVQRARSLLGREELAASREQMFIILALLVWVIITGLFVQAVHGLLVLLRHMNHQLMKLSRVVQRRTGGSAVVFFILGLLSVLKTTGDRPNTIGSATEHSLNDGSLDRLTASRPATSRSSRLLPALSSAGLAVGLTSHVRRQRATVLASAPDHAELGRLSAPSLTSGVALFERAAAADELAPITSHEGDAADENALTPMVIPLGVDNERLVTLTLRPGELLSVDANSSEALSILRHLLNTVVLAPWLDRPTVVLHGFPIDDMIIDGTIRVAHSSQDVFRHVEESRRIAPDKCVVVVARTYVPEFDQLSDRGALVVSIGVETNRPMTRVVRESGGWRVSTTGETFRPYGMTTNELSTLRTMTNEMLTVEVDDRRLPGIQPSWRTLVRVLGPIEVISSDHTEVVFRKAKSVELLCWLAFHRDRPTVSGARTALWEIDVRDATFHNVLSEARRGLASIGLADAVGRATKHRLYLDDQIVTDSDLLRTTLLATKRLPPTKSIEALCETLGLVRGLPFAATKYAWADAEGITSTLYWLVTRSIDRVVELVGGDGDKQALLDATAAGLRMAPGDDQFMRLREQVLVRA